MDSKDDDTVLDASKIEEQQKETTRVLMPPHTIEEFDVLREEFDRNRVSVDDNSVTAATGSDYANRGDPEAKSSAGQHLSSILAERKENSCQSIDSQAGKDMSSYGTVAENIHNITMVENQDSQYSVCNHNDAIKNICVFLDNLPSDFTLEHVITPAVERGKREDDIVDLPGTLRTSKSLKDLSMKEISRLGWPRWKTRNLSESELQRRSIFATQNLCRYMRNKNMGHKVDSTPLGLQPKPSNIPHINVEDTAEAPETQTEVEESGEDSERKAFFYISSSSIPGMGDGSEQTSISGRFQMPSERPVRRIVRHESREPVACLGTQRCHYIVLVIALLTASIGCIVYHLSSSGIGPGILKSIGASTAFISFAVCVFSSIYISYLKNYPQLIPVVPHYELIGDVDSVMAMNRTSDPDFIYGEDGYYTTEASEFIRQTQSADILDRRGYGRQQARCQTDGKRYAEESGTAYSSQLQKKFKAQTEVPAENDVPVESVLLTDLVSDEPTNGQESIKVPERED